MPPLGYDAQILSKPASSLRTSLGQLLEAGPLGRRAAIHVRTQRPCPGIEYELP
jgi:hypothetical protein